jgi:hypothetical protein
MIEYKKEGKAYTATKLDREPPPASFSNMFRHFVFFWRRCFSVIKAATLDEHVNHYACKATGNDKALTTSACNNHPGRNYFTYRSIGLLMIYSSCDAYLYGP